MTGATSPPREAEAKRLAAVVLDVLAGSRTPPQAAETLGVSLPRFYQLEARAVGGLIAACESRPRGRQPEADAELVALHDGMASAELLGAAARPGTESRPSVCGPGRV